MSTLKPRYRFIRDPYPMWIEQKGELVWIVVNANGRILKREDDEKLCKLFCLKFAKGAAIQARLEAGIEIGAYYAKVKSYSVLASECRGGAAPEGVPSGNRRMI